MESCFFYDKQCFEEILRLYYEMYKYSFLLQKKKQVNYNCMYRQYEDIALQNFRMSLIRKLF